MKIRFLTAKKAMISTFVFFMIFQPPLFKFMTQILMTLMTLIIIKRYCQKIVLKHGIVLKAISFFIPFICYVFFLTIFNFFLTSSEIEKSAYIYNSTHIITVLSYAVICYLLLNSISEQYSNFFQLDWTKILVWGVLIETILILASFFSKNLHNTFLNLCLNNFRNEIMLDNISRKPWRTYGLSRYFYDHLSFILSGAVLIAIIKSFETKRMIYLLLGFCMLFASLLGSRTCFVLVIIGFIAILIRHRREILFVPLLKWSIFAIVLIIFGVYCFNQLLDEGFKNWFSRGMGELVMLIVEKENSGTFSEIFDADVVFPPDIILGLGAQPETLEFYDAGGAYIDNGYVQCIWRFGIIGTILFIVGVFQFYRIIYRSSKKVLTKDIAVVFPLILLAYCFKTYPISLYGANVVFFVFPAILLSTEKMKIESMSHARDCKYLL